MKILANIPLFVWPLFVMLMVGGLKARKTCWVPLKALLLPPVAFLIWNLLSFFDIYSGDLVAICLWALFLGLGFPIGFSHIRRLRLRFDKKKQLVEMPGSWIPLALYMSIFTAKFSLGMMRAMLPHLQGSPLFLGLELVAISILGIIAGRGAGCWTRYRSFNTETT